MANEATIVELMGQPKGVPVRFTCADGTGIEKGTILWLDDARSVSGVSATLEPFAGIASVEKVASDGSTTIGCWTKGIFDMYAASAISAGDPVVLSGQNMVSGASVAPINQVIGIALEDATAAETIQVAVGIY